MGVCFSSRGRSDSLNLRLDRILELKVNSIFFSEWGIRHLPSVDPVEIGQVF